MTVLHVSIFPYYSPSYIRFSTIFSPPRYRSFPRPCRQNNTWYHHTRLQPAASRIRDSGARTMGVKPRGTTNYVQEDETAGGVHRLGRADRRISTGVHLDRGIRRGRGCRGAAPPPPGPAEERDHLVRLTDSLSRGVWPTYARLACALNLLALRAMHAQLCSFLASLIWRPDYRARAPLAARVCGIVPFHPAGEGGQALGSTEQDFLADSARTRRGSGGGGGDGSSTSSSTFYSAFLHPLYVWAQCLDRQFYAQVHFCCCCCCCRCCCWLG